MELNNSTLRIKSQFPALNQTVNGRPLIYLDSAATALKPESVIERMIQYYKFETANVHRGAHFLADQLTFSFEKVREKVCGFINSSNIKEIVFVKGTTEGINLIAHGLGHHFLENGDGILVTEMEHHANLVPWQVLAESKNLKFNYVKINDDGDLDWNDLAAKLENSKVFAFTAASNVLGVHNPVKKICTLAKKMGVITVVDAAQIVSHEAIDVRDWGCDFLTFSGHKMFGPMGIGIVYGRESLLAAMGPYQTGGSMISSVSWNKTTFNDLPYRLEAGTPNVDGVIGLGAAIDFIYNQDVFNLSENTRELTQNLRIEVSKIDGVRILGREEPRASLLSLVFDWAHFSDVAHLLDKQGIAVRAGHLCAQPLMGRMKTAGALRVSLSIFNTEVDCKNFLNALITAREMLV